MILLVSNEFPPQRGGIARYLGGVYARVTPGTWERMDPGPHPRWWRVVWQLWKRSRQQAIEEIHCSHIVPIGTACYLLSLFRRIPYRVYVHGMDVATALQRKPWLTRLILRGAKEVIANSEYTAGLVRSTRPSAAVRVQYPKIEPPIHVHEDERRLWRHRHGVQDSFVLLSVGRLVRRKGVDLVILALQNLPPDTVAVIVGTGPEEQYLQELARRVGVSDRVAFIGAVGDEELAAWYASADCFVLPVRTIGTDIEGFGMVYQEAAAYALPSIATNEGGVPESVVHGETGIIVPSDNVPALQQAIRTLREDDILRTRLGVAARARVKNLFMQPV